jgi:hypothetical protein
LKPNASTHYPALNRRRHPTKPSPAVYNAADLPIWTHTEFMAQAQEVQLASGLTERKRLALKYSIKGVSIFSFLSSMSFPTSFPFGSMHLFFENVIPNMVDLWMHRFDTTLLEDDDFIITPGAWKAIAQAGVESGRTIPSAFGARGSSRLRLGYSGHSSLLPHSFVVAFRSRSTITTSWISFVSSSSVSSSQSLCKISMKWTWGL